MADIHLGKFADACAAHRAACDEFMSKAMATSQKADGTVSGDAGEVRKTLADLFVLLGSDDKGEGEASDKDPENTSGEPKDPTHGKQEKAHDGKPRRRLAVDFSNPRMQNASEGSPIYDHGPRGKPAPLLGDIFGGESTPDDAPSIDNIFGS
jgi:hypothetical protein